MKLSKPSKPLIFSLIVLIIILSLATYIFTTYEPNTTPTPQDSSTLTVQRVIDGDTFVLSNNETVRLICIDAPEKGKSGYQEAKDYLSGMILNQEVRLEKDVSETDEYGRLLRYAWVNISGIEFFVNKQIVQEGYGKVFRYGNDTKRCGEISSQ